METKNHQVIGTALILIFIGWILIDIFYPKSAPSPVEQNDPDLIAHLNADFAALPVRGRHIRAKGRSPCADFHPDEQGRVRVSLPGNGEIINK